MSGSDGEDGPREKRSITAAAASTNTSTGRNGELTMEDIPVGTTAVIRRLIKMNANEGPLFDDDDAVAVGDHDSARMRRDANAPNDHEDGDARVALPVVTDFIPAAVRSRAVCEGFPLVDIVRHDAPRQLITCFTDSGPIDFARRLRRRPEPLAHVCGTDPIRSRECSHKFECHLILFPSFQQIQPDICTL